MTELDTLLVRQLKRLGLEDLNRVPELETFTQLLERVSEQYKRTTEDRTLLTRSLDLSTEEMNQLRARAESERDRLQAIVDAIVEAIGQMGVVDMSQDEGTSIGTGIITHAKRVFAERLRTIFGEGHTSVEESSRVRVIETGFVRLADQIESMLKQMASTASLKKEMEVARTVQQMLLPPQDVIEFGSVTLAAYFQPARECGGDWWYAAEQADGKMLVAIGDVTGHGIASAILTGAAKASADLANLMTRGKVAPNVLLHLMNHSIHQAGRQQVMMTAAAGLFDPATKALTLGGAGHVFPFLVRDGTVRPMIVNGPPLGAAASSEYSMAAVQLQSGDLVLWYTDGVTERENDAGEQFSEKRLRAVCQRCSGQNAVEFRDELVRSLLTYGGNAPPTDDMTLLIAHVR